MGVNMYRNVAQLFQCPGIFLLITILWSAVLEENILTSAAIVDTADDYSVVSEQTDSKRISHQLNVSPQFSSLLFSSGTSTYTTPTDSTILSVPGNASAINQSISAFDDIIPVYSSKSTVLVDNSSSNQRAQIGHLLYLTTTSMLPLYLTTMEDREEDVTISTTVVSTSSQAPLSTVTTSGADSRDGIDLLFNSTLENTTASVSPSISTTSITPPISVSTVTMSVSSTSQSTIQSPASHRTTSSTTSQSTDRTPLNELITTTSRMKFHPHVNIQLYKSLQWFFPYPGRFPPKRRKTHVVNRKDTAFPTGDDFSAEKGGTASVV